MPTLIDKMVEILSEEIGGMVARASILMYLKQAGVKEKSVGPQHLPMLAEQLEPALCIFVGVDKAKSLAKRIRGLRG